MRTLIICSCICALLSSCGGGTPSPAATAISPAQPTESAAALPQPESFGDKAIPISEARDHLSTTQYESIQSKLLAQQALLEQQGFLPSAPNVAPVTFSWPLRMAETTQDYGYYAISNFVDHNNKYPQQVLDYNDGQRSYDLDDGYNHSGTDIGLWPFAWQKMDDNTVEVIAAADGIIIEKSDGKPDRNCGIDRNLDWNAVYLRHSDGSVTWYGHLKKGSLTSKRVGSKVQAGEYLGVVGSSGSSGGPHLHFEVHSKRGKIIDPFNGPANPGNALWKEQKPYYDSGINHLGIATAPPEFPPCPEIEKSYEQSSFRRGTLIYFVTYYRDLQPGQISTYRIVRPDNTRYTSWQQTYTDIFYETYYWYWSFRIPSSEPRGEWRFEVEYEGDTYSRTFTLN